LTLALEPEAASLYSKHVIGQAAMYVGCRYMILDIGGKKCTLVHLRPLFHIRIRIRVNI